MRYFKQEEFACRCGGTTPGCKGVHIDVDFADMMDRLRHAAQIPIIITSGYRCPSYNATVGGKSNSAHVKGLAADIKCTDSQRRFWIIKAAIDVGFNRIGIGSDFIHVDYDESLPEARIWHYYTH